VALTGDPTTLRHCTACGDLVEVDANFCPTCGTRQADGIPRPVERPVEPERAAVVTPVDEGAAAQATAGLIVAAVVAAAVLLIAGVVVGRLAAGGGGESGAGAGSASGPAAGAMDHYAPIAEGWEAKQLHVAEEGDGEDAAGLATAAHDARAWLDVNGDGLAAAVGGVRGAAGPLYRQLADVYSRRFAVLGDIEETATAGGTGAGSASGGLAELDALDRRSDSLTCSIADVMRGEGDDPADHITPAMGVAC
jgi:hypothetical protein